MPPTGEHHLHYNFDIQKNGMEINKHHQNYLKYI